MHKKISALIFVVILAVQFLPAQNMKAPEQQAPDREFHMINLNLNLHFDLGKKEVLGVAVEKIAPLRDNYKIIHLQAADMKIYKVVLDKSNLPFKYDGKILSLELSKGYGLKDTLTY